MVNLKQIRDLVIEPALKAVDLYSPEAVDLVLFTGVQESNYRYLKQLGAGPALSFWQMEPATLHDIFENYLKFRTRTLTMVEALMWSADREEQLVGNLFFGAVMCRLKYRRDKMPLPPVGDGPGMAHMWKVVYNTHQGAGLEIEFLESWNKHQTDVF